MGMIVLIMVFIFDLVAFALAVAAEQRRTTVSFLYFFELSINRFYCSMNVVFLRSIIGNLKRFVILILAVLKWLGDWVKL